MSLTDLQRAALQMLAKSPRGCACPLRWREASRSKCCRAWCALGMRPHTVTPSAQKRKSFRTYGSPRLDGVRSRGLSTLTRRIRYEIEPITLGNMRELGVRSLAAAGLSLLRCSIIIRFGRWNPWEVVRLMS
jgi:hypothetical protein